MSSKLPIWIEEKGLSFSCTGCGACCTGAPGFVWLTKKDIDRIVKHLEISKEKFLETYCKKVHGRYTLLENEETYDCVFLKEKKCSLYNARPKQCRTYPFWQEVIQDQKSWEEEQKYCEGINAKKGKYLSKKEIEEIIKQT